MGLGGGPMNEDDYDEDSLMADLAEIEGRPAGGKKAGKPQKSIAQEILDTF